jgi:RNA polymerase sigma factor (sigma-70 family)
VNEGWSAVLSPEYRDAHRWWRDRRADRPAAPPAICGSRPDGRRTGLHGPGEAAWPDGLRACRAILRDPHAAEDAFQATFLVLARKAGGLWVRGSLGPWLLSVAHRVAYCARTDASRPPAHERTAAERAAPATVDSGWDDRDAILHEELIRLPEKYRTAVVLCDLEGLTQEQAARQLGWPDGTVRSRLAQGRERLRERLTRRGMAPAVVLAGQRPLIDLTSVALVQSTVQGALGHVSDQALGAMAAAGVVAAAVATLAEKGMRTMLFARSKLSRGPWCSSAAVPPAYWPSPRPRSNPLNRARQRLKSSPVPLHLDRGGRCWRPGSRRLARSSIGS